MPTWSPPRSFVLRALSLVIGLGIAAASAGCVLVDECTEGATRCHSPGRLESCETGYDPEQAPHWVPTDCAGNGLICTEGTTGKALCAVSAEPVAVCAPGPGERCDGDRLVLCAEGLAAYQDVCEATCVATVPTEPFCVLARAPDPLCDAPPSRCDGTTRIDCRDGYRTREVACEGAGGCQLEPITYQNGVFETAFCALAPAPDARCPEADNLAFAGQSSFCEGDLLFECYGGFLVQRLACAPRPDAEPACVTPRPGDSECQTMATVLEGSERGSG